MSVAIPRSDSIDARSAAPTVTSATLDLRGSAASPVPGAHVLEDPSGRRARRVTRLARLVGAAFLLWLVLLVFGGIGLLPAGGVPFGKLILPTDKPIERAEPQSSAPGSSPSAAGSATPGASPQDTTVKRAPNAADGVIVINPSATAAPMAQPTGSPASGSGGSTASGGLPQAGRQTGSSGTAPGSGKSTGASGTAPGSGKSTGASGTAPGSGKSTGSSHTSGTTGSGKEIPGQARRTGAGTGTAPTTAAPTTDVSRPSSGPSASNGQGSVRSRSARDADTLSAVPAPPAN